MIEGFVQTNNYKRFLAGVHEVERRAAREAGYLLVTGPAGLGKSESVAKFSMEQKAVLVRAKSTSTKRGLLDELADSLGLAKTGRTQDVQNRIIGALVAKVGKNSAPYPIVVDEAEFTISRNAASLEAIRDITDMTGSMCVIVGMENIERDLARYPQIASRINSTVEFLPLTEADVRSACKQKCEVAVSDDAAAHILRVSGGKMRLILNAIVKIEQIAKSKDLTKVSFADIKDRDLCFEWQSRSPRRVMRPNLAAEAGVTSMSGAA